MVMSLGTSCGDDGEGLPVTTTTGATSPTGPTGDPTGAPTTDAMTTGATGEATTGTTTGAGGDPWMTPYCYSVSDMKWLGPWIDREQQVLDRINAVRATGVDCGTSGSFAATSPLTREPRLHCASRRHAQDMAERDFNSHINPDGEGFAERIHQAGYVSYASAGENIAAGADDPVIIVQGWLASDEHCANLMNPQYRHTGVGFYEGAGSLTYYWTQTFAAPLR